MHTNGLATRTAELHLQCLPQKSIKTLRERDLGVKAARNTVHNHIRDWWAGVLANCGDRVETEQFVSECEAEKRLGGHPTFYDIVVSSPWTTGTHEGAGSEHKGQPHEDRAVKAAETNKMRDCKPPPSTEAAHIILMSFDVYGRWGEKAELALKQEREDGWKNVMR